MSPVEKRWVETQVNQGKQQENNHNSGFILLIQS